MEPLVSVIVPVYKVEQYLPRCIDSIIGQTYENLEIILVDDGSPDSCGKICDEYAAKDPRIKVIHKENAGVSAARNTGLDTATGEYIMFVDSDDYLALDATEVLYTRMQRDGSDMAVGKHIEIYDDGRTDDLFCRWMEDSVYTANQVYEKLGHTQCVPVAAWGKLYRREIFEGVRFNNLVCGEDLCLHIQILEKSKKVSVTNKLIYYYYQRTTSVMHSTNPRKQYDQIEANLYAAKVLWERQLYQGASKWFNLCILYSYWVKDTKPIRGLYNQYFKMKETAKMLMYLPIKQRLRWLSIYIPCMKRIAGWRRIKSQKV